MTYEKRRRRRESHNAVERRRRDNINDRIQDLYTLLPETMIDANTKPNKGIILKKSVDYIRQMQQLVHSLAQQIQELGGVPNHLMQQLDPQQQQQQQQQHSPTQQQQQQQASGLAAMLAGTASMNVARNDGGAGHGGM
ncbi:helix-loop-helix DNA-binding protein [Linderina pennispora]|uniref:Helix-loop-helix DNA-binding protein n=1 Tax=Linderina pennispora TaxID=61395 RepID=A0A1Y1W1T4_9FUNG|nr:helix-loop-helix DNA-binding protein [Linderina pennispora]ORX67412.1 helix-loop-helix DNA-binding protein [Linderina pennispora]